MDLSKIIDMMTTGVKVDAAQYQKMKKAQKGAMAVLALYGEALDEMGPEDDTPYQLTGMEIVQATLGKLGDKLGNE